MSVIDIVLVILTVASFGLGFFIFLPLALLIGIAALVFIIIAAMEATKGKAYRYPFALRLVK